MVGQLQPVLHIIHQRRRRNIQADFANGVLEPQAVFGHLDRAQRRANQFDAVFFQNAAFRQFHGKVQAGLPANGGQQRLRAFHGDDLFQIFLRQRLDVGAVGNFRVGHDRGRIGIHQHDFVALAAQRFARLRARIVEFAGLPDHDGAGADDHDFLDVGALRHGRLGLGLSAPQCAGEFPVLHHVGELAEQIMRVVRPGRSLGMILHGKQRQAAVAQAFVGVVIQIQVRDFHVARGQRVRDPRRSRDSAR